MEDINNTGAVVADTGQANTVDVDTGASENQGIVSIIGEPNIPSTDSNNPTEQPTEEIELPKDFDPLQMDFTKPLEKRETTNYQDLKELGIKIDTDDFQMQLQKLEDLGITDLATQKNVLKSMREAYLRDNPSPAEIQKNLNKNLSPEEKSNFSSISNRVFNAFKSEFGEQNGKLAVKEIMSEPIFVKALNVIFRNERGGNTVVPKPAESSRKAGGLTSDQATILYQSKMTEALKKGDNNTVQEGQRNAIINEIMSKINPAEIKEFKDYFGIK